MTDPNAPNMPLPSNEPVVNLPPPGVVLSIADQLKNVPSIMFPRHRGTDPADMAIWPVAGRLAFLAHLIKSL